MGHHIRAALRFIGIKNVSTLYTFLSLAAILALAFTFRYLGFNWDDFTLSHPDELFLRTITSEVGESHQLRHEVELRCHDDPDRNGYFNTQCNPLNPNNIEDGSFAYGTLPVFMVKQASRMLADLRDERVWLSFQKIHLVGRGVNIAAELVSIVFIFLIGLRLLTRKQALLAALFYAAAVLPIQLTHFWTVDIISHLFFIITLYIAVRISQNARFLPFYPLFGIALGAAVASRLNLAAAAVLAPIAVFIYLRPTFPLRLPEDPTARRLHLLNLTLIGIGLALAAACALVTFRIAQPYAFKGPGFTDIQWNEKWRDDIKVVSDYATQQDDGWPPSHQFVDRISYAYPWFNMVMWGMGLPLGITATLALLVALYRQVRAQRFSPQVGLLCAWILLYFAWQGQLHYMTLRYYLPLYAPLCLLAAWWVGHFPFKPQRVLRTATAAGTMVWALAYMSIYLQPQTRVEAAYWIADHIPATVNVMDASGNVTPMNIYQVHPFQMHSRFNQRLPFANQTFEGEPFTLSQPIQLDEVWLKLTTPVDLSVSMSLYQVTDTNVGSGYEIRILTGFTSRTDEVRWTLTGEEALSLPVGTYRWNINLNWLGSAPLIHFIGGMEWREQGSGEKVTTAIPLRNFYRPVQYAYLDPKYKLNFLNYDPRTITRLYIPHVIGEPDTLTLAIDGTPFLATVEEIVPNNSVLGPGAWFRFEAPVQLPSTARRDPRTLITPEIALHSTTPIFITGSAIATEGSWDFATPSDICWRPQRAPVGSLDFESCRSYGGYNAGWYVELPLEMVEKAEMFQYLYRLDILLKADYLTISTNRMYDGLIRNQKYYAYTQAYYDALFASDLNYEEITRFNRFPRFGLTFPDQALPDEGLPDWMNELEAEEAFTVYDHPTIYVFENRRFTADSLPIYFEYVDPRNRIELAAVEPPRFKFAHSPASDNALWQITALWTLAFLAIGWLSFPLMYRLFPNLPLRGFGFGRSVAWLGLAFVPWWLTAAFDLPFWRREALAVFTALFVMLNLFIGWRLRHELLPYLRRRWRALLGVELVWLIGFAICLYLRAGNPDYWHQWLGGEKPMDLAYLHATLRAEAFAPPNPWLAGFNINYYYLGFVMVGMPLKLLAIPSEIAANLALVTLYATVFQNIFSLILSVLNGTRVRWQVLLAVLGTVLIMIAGNWATINRLLFDPLENMAEHRWYWEPTRVITESHNGQGSVINEMPLFSFLYGDLHAHMMALLPVTLFLLITLTLVQQRRRLWIPVIGVLLSIIYMMNTWDILVYVPLIVIVLWFISGSVQNWLLALLTIGISGYIAAFPYLQDFTLSEYGQIERWEGPRTLLNTFILVWGPAVAVLAIWLAQRLKAVFFSQPTLIVKVAFLVLTGFCGVLLAEQTGALLLFLTFILALVLMALRMIPITPLILLLGGAVIFSVGGEAGTSLLLGLLLCVALLLALVDRQLTALHLAIAFFLSGLLAIEYVVIVGDTGRTNTGFKVSFQLWIWVGILIPVLLYQMIRTTRAYGWVALSLVLLAPTLLYPLKAIPARHADSHTDRFTLDGYAFMESMELVTNEGRLSLDGDAGLIKYLQARMEGYPVIAEAVGFPTRDHFLREYFWHSRFASYTGLPTVVGWRGHLAQQYSHQTQEVEERSLRMQRLFTTNDPAEIRDIVERYDIDYIAFGTLEYFTAPPETEAAFDRLIAENFLDIVYQRQGTRLYKVNTP